MSATRILAGRRILVIEDEFLIAMEVSQMISDLGGEVVGPSSSVAIAEDLLVNSTVDGAVVDVRLGRETTADFVEILRTRGVPLVLTTGYSDDSLPPGLSQIPRLTKPYSKAGFEEIVKRHLVRRPDVLPR
jgi:two-component SAPR family response regulator